MKKRRVMLVLAGLLVVLVVAVSLGRLQREPQYVAIKLSEWARGYPRNREAADKALRQVGTNALPWLLEWLPNEPLPPWKVKLFRDMTKLPPFLGRNYAQRALGLDSMNQSQFAWQGFRVLGREARSAIPDLVRIACNPKYPHGGKAASYILLGFHEEAIPSLLTILRRPQAPGRRPAIDYFRETSSAALGTNASAAAEALALCLTDSDALTRNDAAVALANLPLRPELTVPALAKSTTDTVAEVRISSLAALAAFGDLARPATPAIRRALTDGDADVRAAAAYALDQVATEERQ